MITIMITATRANSAAPPPEVVEVTELVLEEAELLVMLERVEAVEELEVVPDAVELDIVDEEELEVVDELEAVVEVEVVVVVAAVADQENLAMANITGP